MGTPDAMTPIELMRHRNSLMHSEESVRKGREFATRSTDVFIVTYPKCGTTWMTQLCHQLRCTRARAPSVDAMGFGEITEVVPWDILASDCGQRLEDDQVCEPRLFKSHESASDIARGARYVCVVRDPMDVFHSFYHFLPPYMGIPHGAVTREAFADAVFAGASHSGQCWDHFLGWWDRRHEPETLIVCFEDMKENLEKVARRVARHLFPPGAGGSGSAAADLGEAALAGACERSGFEAMRRDASKFDDHFVRRKMWTRVGIDESEWAPAGGAHVGKVREGGGAVGRGREATSPELRRRIDARWDDVMRPRGFETYAAFRAAIEAHNAERDAKARSAGERE